MHMYMHMHIYMYRYTMRTKCLLVRATFAERVEELEAKLQDVSAAVQEVRSSMYVYVHLCKGQ